MRYTIRQVQGFNIRPMSQATAKKFAFAAQTQEQAEQCTDDFKMTLFLNDLVRWGHPKGKLMKALWEANDDRLAQFAMFIGSVADDEGGE
jgi:ADP-ribosylglycohydrolase